MKLLYPIEISTLANVIEISLHTGFNVETWENALEEKLNHLTANVRITMAGNIVSKQKFAKHIMKRRAQPVDIRV